MLRLTTSRRSASCIRGAARSVELKSHWVSYAQLSAGRFAAGWPRNTQVLRFSTGATRKQEATLADPAEHKEDGKDVKASRVMDEDGSVKNTGEIDKNYRELLLYYSRLFLPSGQFGRFIPNFLYSRSNQSKLNTVTKHIPKGLPVEVDEFIPRENEGGAFVKLRITDPTFSEEKVWREIQRDVHGHKHRFIDIEALHWRVYPVLGKPWIEDMRRVWTTRVRVTFEGPDVSPEDLYANLRRYGRINDIIPPAPGNKDSPRSTLIDYKNYVDATTARNCANGQVINGTTIHISFVNETSSNAVWEWLTSHPRISIPLLIAVVAGLAFLIFEPIRVFFVTVKVRGSFFSEQLADRFPVYAQFRDWMRSWRSIITFGGHEEENVQFSASWQELAAGSERLEKALNEGTNTFIVVSGPRGSGKSRLVRGVMKQGNRPVLELDCEALERTKSDNAFLSSLSNMLGYFPVFLWTNNMSKFIDLAAQSLAGQPSGFSETTDQQSKRMLATAVVALHNVAIMGKPKDVKESDFLQSHPNSQPVVIIRGFKAGSGPSKLLAEWAGGLVQANVAQVVFITQDVGYDKMLSEALPNRVFETITIADATAAAAKRYILDYTGHTQVSDADKEKGRTAFDTLEPDAKNAIRQLERLDSNELEPLGGRLTDLQAFTRRLLAGEPPMRALNGMIDQSATEISQMYLNAKNSDWTSAQVWTLIRYLAELKTDQDWLPVAGGLQLSPLFTTEAQLDAVKALERREMITGRSVGGRLTDVRPGKPLYFAAFKRLAQDQRLCAIMDSEVLALHVKDQVAKIQSAEQELDLLAKLPNRWETAKRADYLASKVAAAQVKIDELEKDIKGRQADLQKYLTEHDRK